MRFTADGARRTGERTFVIEGNLELLGKTQPLALEAVWNKSGEYPFGGEPYVMGVSARGSLRRSAFGMSYGVDNDWVGDEVTIIVELEARRQ
jgi:polyisoprenoid-binding protein YceI